MRNGRDENRAAAKSEYNGKPYYFCAIACQKKFDSDPARYVAGEMPRGSLPRQ